MLSDTISDHINHDEILSEIKHYRENSNVYEYPDSLLDEIENITNRLSEIRIKLDIGNY